MANQVDSVEGAESGSVSLALKRAGNAASAAYFGRSPGSSPDTTMASSETRQLWAHVADVYCNLAQALQVEREYEERKIKEIRDGAEVQDPDD